MKDVAKLVEEAEAKPGKGPTPGGPMGPMGSGAGGFGSMSGGGGGGVGFGPMPGAPTGGPSRAAGLTVLTLKHAAAAETAQLLKRVFPTAEVTADDRTNQLVVRADAKTLEELQALLAKLDVQVPRSK